jgi:peptidoglycan biosynthesis protein MviN/MurJ (putative lipid II flippase)
LLKTKKYVTFIIFQWNLENTHTSVLHRCKWGVHGASVAKWLAHLPFTSKVAGSNLNENFSMWLEPSPHVKRVKVNAQPKVVGFLRLRFPPTGKVDRVG